jgi:Flp pilus assembly protein TadG
MLRTFYEARSGQIAVIVAFAAIPVIVGTGMALDYSHGAKKRADLQAALDSSVLAGISISAREAKYGNSALKIAAKNFDALKPEPTATAQFSISDGVLRGTAALKVKSSFGSLVGVDYIETSVASAATTNPQRHPICFMARHPTRKHTLELHDSVSVIAPDCHIYGNSEHVDDVVDPHTPNNHLVGKTVQAVGFGHHYIENVKPPLEHAPEILDDPLASLPYPSPGGCKENNLVVTGNNKKLKPGTYCNGLTFNNANGAELESGTYIIRGGGLSIQNSSIRGNRVTIVILGANPVNWNNSSINIVAPNKGPLAGMGILAERVSSISSISNTNIDVHGVIYMPHTELTWTNSGDFRPSAKWTTWIVDGISWNGSGVIRINFKIDDKKAEVPYPSQLMNVVPTVGPGRVRLVR